jgi:Protein of unknown function (DUF3455)
MNKQQDRCYRSVLIFTLLFTTIATTAITACNDSKEVLTYLPSYHISQSEKLEIPGAITVPANLPGGNVRVATFYATGVQKYKAQFKAGGDPATLEWVFVAPKANLYDATNKIVGNHSAGPTWQLLGSVTDSIYGQPFNPARTAASPRPYTIDWLLLMPKTGKTPTGIFKDVVYIQRIETNGGKPRKQPEYEGQTIEVNYTAIYRFTKKNP